MQHGRVFLLGDAAHTISLAGGKGMNLAPADAEMLAAAPAAYFASGEEQPLAHNTAGRQPTRDEARPAVTAGGIGAAIAIGYGPKGPMFTVSSISHPLTNNGIHRDDR